MFDMLLYGVLPYVAFTLAVVVGIYRYSRDRFSFSSFSSQLLENRWLFWGSVPWHYGIVILLIGHLIGLVIPDAVAAWNGEPVRLYILEVTAFGLALFALLGIVVLFARRWFSLRLRIVTSRMDMLLVMLLLVQVSTGIATALGQRWGSWWYLSNAVPYLVSLATLQPQIQYATTLPFPTQIHVVDAFLLVAIFPFSRLVHIFTPPITYLWRGYQTVIWQRRQRRPDYS